MIDVILFFIFFFFSSRRRHTRSKRDWSSDVCSSDLWRERQAPNDRRDDTMSDNKVIHFEIVGKDGAALQRYYSALFGWKLNTDNPRSEERRVGKECRSRWRRKK